MKERSKAETCSQRPSSQDLVCDWNIPLIYTVHSMTTPRLHLDILSEIPLYFDLEKTGKLGSFRETRRACCLASRVFLHAARQQMFETLYLHGWYNRFQGLAASPHITAYAKCLSLIGWCDKTDQSSLATIFRNIPGVTKLQLNQGFPRDQILANAELRSAFMDHLSPLIHTLFLSSVPEFGTFFLSRFTHLKLLTLHCALRSDPLQDGPPIEPMVQIEELQLFHEDVIQDGSLKTLKNFFVTHGSRLRRIRWYNISEPEHEVFPSLGSPFLEFFVPHSKTLTELIISSSRPNEFNLFTIPPYQHPWAPQNLPCLEILQIPAFGTEFYGPYVEDKYVVENITWIATVLNSLTFAHPLKALHIWCPSEDIENFHESTPWKDLDEVLQITKLSSLEEFVMRWDYVQSGAQLDEDVRERFLKTHLPFSYERGIVYSTEVFEFNT
ncbi:hypothetical protein DL96DRAFT_117485 [Flagelloscypha sp. PMI_526]|nr:hypothetical protein DL96DRAFT_117485 [Flagelloscypha sp. PMI_526]